MTQPHMRLTRSAAFVAFVWAMCLLPVARATCLNPVPDPTKAGWTKEGNGTTTTGNPLVLTDPSIAPADFLNYFCADSTIFSGDIVLTPHFTIDSAGLTVAPDGNTGIHVTINDGVKLARAFVIDRKSVV